MPANPSRTWRENFGDPRDKFTLPPFVPPNPDLADACHGEDSGFAVVTDAEAVTGADGAVLLFHDFDIEGPAANLELSAWPSDADAGHVAESAYWSGPLADADAGHGTDGPTPVVFLQSGSDASGQAADAGPGGTETIDIYTFQPPFRFTGGQYSLVLPVRHASPEIDEMRELALWRGERPDGTALRLYAAFAAGRLHFASDTDRAAPAREEGEAASLQVTVHIAPALPVHLAVS